MKKKTKQEWIDDEKIKYCQIDMQEEYFRGFREGKQQARKEGMNMSRKLCWKLGRDEMRKEFIKIIKDLDARYGMTDVCENKYGLNKPSIIFHIKDWEALIKQLEEKK